jgi:hypothetical protein
MAAQLCSYFVSPFTTFASSRTQRPPEHAPSCLRLRPCQQGPRHPGYSGLARPSVDHQHGGLHRVGAEQVQGLLSGMNTGVARSERRNIFSIEPLCTASVWVAMREAMHKEFACPVCDSPAIVYPEEGEQDRVVCGGCGAFLATRNQFRRLVEEHAGVQTSGC